MAQKSLTETNLPTLLFPRGATPDLHRIFGGSAFFTPMKDDSDYRSLTPKPGWLKKVCERCAGDFWLAPGQFDNIRYCKDECRHEPPEVRFWKSVTQDGPMHPRDPDLGCCWNSAFTPSKPYPFFKINGKDIRCSRFVLELILGRPLADKLEACHSCDNTRCVNPAHISEGTRKRNHGECVERGRNPKGESHGNAILNDELVRQLKLLKGTMTLKEASAQTGVNWHTIANIWCSGAWKHIVVDAPH